MVLAQIHQYWRWKRDPKEQLFFSRRNRIYRAVQQLMNQGLSESNAVQTLENDRASCNLLLDKLQKSLHD